MNQKQLIVPILFYGALWGILEATVGHVLHFIPATIAGSIMFPIASMILYKAYQKTSSTRALFLVAVIAATIKSVNFLLPALSIYKTINPIMSILLEGLVVALVIRMVTSTKRSTQISGWFSASIAWRVVFVGWMGVQYITTGNLAPYIADSSALFQFVLVSGAISALFAFVLIELQKRVTWNVNLDQQWTLATLLLILAGVLTYTL